MRLNTLKPAVGAKKIAKRVGRGIGSGWGKTCGRGHKGQHSRSGGFHKVGFEGGQMPLQRRLPKVGFVSSKSKSTVEVRLHELDRLSQETTVVVDLMCLKRARIIPLHSKRAKIIAAGKISKAFRIKGLLATRGARAAIEAAGGSIDEDENKKGS